MKTLRRATNSVLIADWVTSGHKYGQITQMLFNLHCGPINCDTV
jgi:hypothetical protein